MTDKKKKRSEEDIDEALEETFPASDVPSYMPPEPGRKDRKKEQHKNK